jgi:hypothetical protein
MQTARRPGYRAEDTRRPTHRIRLALLKHGRYMKQAEQEWLEWRELVRISMEPSPPIQGQQRTPWLICWLNSAITTNSLARIPENLQLAKVIETALLLRPRMETAISRGRCDRQRRQAGPSVYGGAEDAAQPSIDLAVLTGRSDDGRHRYYALPANVDIRNDRETTMS